jgi:regulator of protease activity HflC (stomatin/prohibitin superfamily)
MKDTVVGLGVLGFLFGIIAFGMWGCPQYNVWQQRMAGQAKLAEAESSRKITIQEAKAKLESAKMLADAEVERAKGVAQANTIIGDSLKNNESYLRYLWIENLEKSEKNGSVIYVPTEAGLPILEAGKR